MYVKAGNIVLFGGMPMRVLDVENVGNGGNGGNGENCLVTVERSWGGVFRVEAEQLEPIAITPYYLVRSMHFNLVGQDQVIMEKRTPQFHAVMVRTNLLSWCLLLDGTIVEEIRYLHELQNMLKFEQFTLPTNNN